MAHSVKERIFLWKQALLAIRHVVVISLITTRTLLLLISLNALRFALRVIVLDFEWFIEQNCRL